MSETVFPILDVYSKSANISQKLVDELRQKFLERVDKNPELYYSQDIEKIKTNDWSLRRFLFDYKSDPEVNKALESLDKAMKWRKSFGVREITDKDFAKEGYQSAALMIYGKDRNGAPLIISRGKVAKKSKAWREHVQKFLVKHIETIDEKNEGKGLTVLMDSRDAGLKNADLDVLKFTTTVMQEYYPGLVNAILIYKMPAVLEAIYKMFRSWLNEEQTKYMYLISKKNINDYVAIDQLPDFLLGTNTQPYRVVPEGVSTIHEVAEKLGLKPEKADKMVKHLEKFYTN